MAAPAGGWMSSAAGPPGSAMSSPRWGRPVNSEPRPCLLVVGFPLSGLQDRTHTSDLNVRAQHTRLRPTGSAPARSSSARLRKLPNREGHEPRIPVHPAPGDSLE